MVLVALALAAGAISQARQASWTGAAVLASLLALLAVVAVVSFRRPRGR